MVIFFLKKRKYRFFCFLTIHFTFCTVQNSGLFPKCGKNKLRKRWRVLVSYLHFQRIRLNDKSLLCTMSKSFGDGIYDAKKTRVNSGLLYAVFLLPNPKFSQLNALAWTSSSPPPVIKLVLEREIRITSWYNSDVTFLHLLVIMCFLQIHVILLVCCWLYRGHVGGPGQKHFSPLATQSRFHVISSKRILLYWPPTWHKQKTNQEWKALITLGRQTAFLSSRKLYYLLFLIAKRAREENNYLNVEMTKQTSTDGSPHQTEGDLDELLQDYKSFHDSWVERCKRLHGKPYGC